MLFNFLKYVQPTSYFNLKISNKLIFPDIRLLPNDIVEKLNRDASFKSVTATNMDLSWQAIQHGYIGESETIAETDPIPLEDEYRFVRKYFNPIWASYCLVIRVLCLNNPLTEFNAWLKSRNVRRESPGADGIFNKEWHAFDSKLLKVSPKITVIIPTLNRYKYLFEVLSDFEKQDYKYFEIIIVDQSDNFSKKFYKQFDLDIQVIHQKEKALWLARNSAINVAKGKFIAL